MFLQHRTKASASTVAARTGAAAYEESRESLRSDEVKTKVRKRLAIDPDVDEVDLENYQGVLGRPGVDFPVLTGIPKTNFSCKEYGNGYFADLETDCQVCLIFLYLKQMQIVSYRYRCSTYVTKVVKSPSYVQTAPYSDNLI